MSTFPSDLEIAQNAPIRHIKEIAAKLGIDADDLHYYGKHKAKLPLNLIDDEKIKKSKLILFAFYFFHFNIISFMQHCILF